MFTYFIVYLQLNRQTDKEAYKVVNELVHYFQNDEIADVARGWLRLDSSTTSFIHCGKRGPISSTRTVRTSWTRWKKTEAGTRIRSRPTTTVAVPPLFRSQRSLVTAARCPPTRVSAYPCRARIWTEPVPSRMHPDVSTFPTTAAPPLYQTSPKSSSRSFAADDPVLKRDRNFSNNMNFVCLLLVKRPVLFTKSSSSVPHQVSPNT